MGTEKQQRGTAEQESGQLGRLSGLDDIPNVQVILVRGCGDVQFGAARSAVQR